MINKRHSPSSRRRLPAVLFGTDPHFSYLSASLSVNCVTRDIHFACDLRHFWPSSVSRHKLLSAHSLRFLPWEKKTGLKSRKKYFLDTYEIFYPFHRIWVRFDRLFLGTGANRGKNSHHSSEFHGFISVFQKWC